MIEERTLTRLEFYKILDLLAKECTSIMGRELALAVRPVADAKAVQSNLSLTTEAKNVLRLNPTIPLGGFRDIRNQINKTEVGGILEPGELADVLSTLQAARRMKAFLAGQKAAYPGLRVLEEQLVINRNLEERLDASLSPDGDIADDASVELARLRRQIKNLQGRVKDRLDSIIRSPAYLKMLQDPIITIRADRYVVPVKSEYRSQFQGLVHDQSASGATLFIEPLAVVEVNNDLRRALSAEEQEVHRILRELTGLVRSWLPELRITIGALAELDLAMAKARLSQKYDGGEPALSPDGVFRIVQGRHPLLPGRPVPTNVELGLKFDVLVITGPNTGGKTVTLKTIGLFALMGQAGLHLPAETGTMMPVVEQIFTDIGDEQSIEQSLSTFSSHLKNIVEMVNNIRPGALVLLDELGAGTDPTEGSALAMGILEFLLQKGARVVATTHYGALKTFAYNTPRVENASVEFDTETLQPTYRLLVGTPGRSNAFAIAARLGLPGMIIERAGDFLSSEELRVADLLQNLEENQRQSERARAEAEAIRSVLLREKREITAMQDEIRRREAQVLAKARDEAIDIVARARQEAEKAVREIRSLMLAQNRQASLEAAETARVNLRREAENLEEQIRETRTVRQVLSTVQPGDYVFIPRLNLKGQVISRPGPSGEVTVQAGIMKINVPLADLERNREEKPHYEATGAGSIAAGKAQNISSELDLRGLMVDEAMAEVEKYLDDAYLAGLPQVVLIHGKGTGALRAGIRSYLNGHPLVKSHRLGAYGEGGVGVTVVEVKSS